MKKYLFFLVILISVSVSSKELKVITSYESLTKSIHFVIFTDNFRDIDNFLEPTDEYFVKKYDNYYFVEGRTVKTKYWLNDVEEMQKSQTWIFNSRWSYLEMEEEFKKLK